MFDIKDYFREDFSPRKCKSCGGISFRDVIKDRIDHLVTEYEVRCTSCTSLCSYWAYGYFDPIFAMEASDEILYGCG